VVDAPADEKTVPVTAPAGAQGEDSKAAETGQKRKAEGDKKEDENKVHDSKGDDAAEAKKAKTE
jgi:hypothetical protein